MADIITESLEAMQRLKDLNRKEPSPAPKKKDMTANEIVSDMRGAGVSTEAIVEAANGSTSNIVRGRYVGESDGSRTWEIDVRCGNASRMYEEKVKIVVDNKEKGAKPSKPKAREAAPVDDAIGYVRESLGQSFVREHEWNEGSRQLHFQVKANLTDNRANVEIVEKLNESLHKQGWHVRILGEDLWSLGEAVVPGIIHESSQTRKMSEFAIEQLWPFIQSGDRITIFTKRGDDVQTRTGKVVPILFKKGQDRIVLDMGGAHGTPGSAEKGKNVYALPQSVVKRAKQAGVEIKPNVYESMILEAPMDRKVIGNYEGQAITAVTDNTGYIEIIVGDPKGGSQMSSKVALKMGEKISFVQGTSKELKDAVKKAVKAEFSDAVFSESVVSESDARKRAFKFYPQNYPPQHFLAQSTDTVMQVSIDGDKVKKTKDKGDDAKVKSQGAKEGNPKPKQGERSGMYGKVVSADGSFYGESIGAKEIRLMTGEIKDGKNQDGKTYEAWLKEAGHNIKKVERYYSDQYSSQLSSAWRRCEDPKEYIRQSPSGEGPIIDESTKSDEDPIEHTAEEVKKKFNGAYNLRDGEYFDGDGNVRVMSQKELDDDEAAREDELGESLSAIVQEIRKNGSVSLAKGDAGYAVIESAFEGVSLPESMTIKKGDKVYEAIALLHNSINEGSKEDDKNKMRFGYYKDGEKYTVWDYKGSVNVGRKNSEKEAKATVAKLNRGMTLPEFDKGPYSDENEKIRKSMKEGYEFDPFTSDTPKSKFDPFVAGYIAAALFSGVDEKEAEEHGKDLKDITVDDLEPESIKKMTKIASDFKKKYKESIDKAIEVSEAKLDEFRLGSLLYYSISGAGVDWFDDEENEHLEKLKKAPEAKHYASPYGVYFGDDGKLYSESTTPSKGGLDSFMKEYEKQLKIAVEKYPEDYPWAHEDTEIIGNLGRTVAKKSTVAEVASRMRTAIENNTFSHDGHAFKATCKALGIKHTKKAILDYIKGDLNEAKKGKFSWEFESGEGDKKKRCACSEGETFETPDLAVEDARRYLRDVVEKSQGRIANETLCLSVFQEGKEEPVAKKRFDISSKASCDTSKKAADDEEKNVSESNKPGVTDKSDVPTKVVFRKWKDDGEIIALFPQLKEAKPGTVSSFMHHGQHAAADMGIVMSETDPASPEEYKALKKELESAPYKYNLEVSSDAEVKSESADQGKMTKKQVTDAIKELGLKVKYDSALREWQVSPDGSDEKAYYTDDAEDALNTARKMAEESK